MPKISIANYTVQNEWKRSLAVIFLTNGLILQKIETFQSSNECPAIPPDSNSISTQKLQLFFSSDDLKWFIGPDFFLFAAYAMLKQTKVDNDEFEASTSA